jgi:hypothetical protein
MNGLLIVLRTCVTASVSTSGTAHNLHGRVDRFSRRNLSVNPMAPLKTINSARFRLFVASPWAKGGHESVSDRGGNSSDLGNATLREFLMVREQRHRLFGCPFARLRKTKKIGDEVRGEGFVVRRVENGLRYIEGSRSLTFGSGWAFVEKQRFQASDGSMKSGDKLLVNITVSATSKRRWDAPHDNEKISADALLQISSKSSAALNFDRVFDVKA